MKICLDAGHGMSNIRSGVEDCGASYAGLHEADINLLWVLTAKWVLSREGISVWLTRDDDSDPDPVATRDDRAERAGCTHFLSFHVNAGPAAASGVEVFYRSAGDKVWASRVQKAALDATGLKDRGLRTEGQSQHSRLAVFDFSGPCALVELGYLTNAKDRAVLVSREARLKFAEELAKQIKAMRR